MDNTGRHNGNQTEDTLCDILGEMIEEEIHAAWLHKVANPTVKLAPSDHRGGTNAIIFKATVNVELFVKYHPKDAVLEYEGFKRLQAGPERFTTHLISPLLSTNPSLHAIWLTPHARAKALHDVVSDPFAPSEIPQWLVRLYQDFLDSTRALWIQSRKRVRPLTHEIYVSRVYSRLNQLEHELRVQDLKRHRVKLNGHYVGVLGDILAKFQDQVEKASLPLRHSCLAHYDEHAKNVMVDEHQSRQDSTAWFLIDYVNARLNADWVFSIAKMLYWWEFYCVLERAKTEQLMERSLGSYLNVDDRDIVLSYNRGQLHALVPPACLALRRQVMRFADKVGQGFKEEKSAWQHRLKLALFAVIFGTAARQLPAWRFAVPVMIGESLNVLNATSLDEWFASPSK